MSLSKARFNHELSIFFEHNLTLSLCEATIVSIVIARGLCQSVARSTSVGQANHLRATWVYPFWPLYFRSHFSPQAILSTEGTLNPNLKTPSRLISPLHGVRVHNSSGTRFGFDETRAFRTISKTQTTHFSVKLKKNKLNFKFLTKFIIWIPLVFVGLTTNSTKSNCTTHERVLIRYRNCEPSVLSHVALQGQMPIWNGGTKTWFYQISWFIVLNKYSSTFMYYNGYIYAIGNGLDVDLVSGRLKSSVQFFLRCFYCY